MKILVVDDEEAVRDSLEELLSTEGYECRSAENGLEALKHLESYTPDVMILDFNMPLMNGLELVKHIDSGNGTPKFSIVMVSGDISEKEAKSSVRHGVSKIIKKPIQFDQLRDFLASRMA